MENSIQADKLCKSYKLSKKQQKIDKTLQTHKVAVSDLSFDVKRGEIYGLLGANGAGKTTTLRMLAGLIRPDSGDAHIADISVVDNPEKVRSRIGFLTSELKLEDVFSPNYLFDFFTSLHGVASDKAASRKKELFARFGIDDFAETKVGDLSTGMKQKVSLAIAIAHDPSIVIFDEPTNGLDVLTAKTVTDFLLDLRAEGKTVILSTHIFSLVEKVCDRVGIIMDGHMELTGTLTDITKGISLEDVFFDLYESRKGLEA